MKWTQAHTCAHCSLSPHAHSRSLFSNNETWGISSLYLSVTLYLQRVTHIIIHTFTHGSMHEVSCVLTGENSHIGGASDVTNGRKAICRLFDRYGGKINTHTQTHDFVCILHILSRPHISVTFMYLYSMSFMYMLCNASMPTCLYKDNVCAFICTY